MTALTEGPHAGEFIVSEATVGATGVARGRTAGTLAAGENLTAGTVLGIVTSSGEYAAYDNVATDGTEAAAGILFAGVDATGGALPCVVLDADCEVNGAEINWNGQLQAAIDAGIADLAALGIRVR